MAQDDTYTASELIEALRRRSRRSLRPERAPGEFPSGWAAWFAAMRERIGAVTGATADAFVAIFLQRELARPGPRSDELNRWQAFATLWRQEWQPAAPDSRRERIVAYVITFVVHVILALLLVWLAYVRFMGASVAPQGEEIVQVEFIGEGTPDTEGGGAATGPAPQPDAASAAPSPAVQQASAAAAAPAAPAEPAAASDATPQPLPEPTPSQPLVVTETPVPDSNFTLPPATAREPQVQAPTVRTPEVREAVREIEMPVAQPRVPVRALQPRPTTATLQVPQVREQVADIPVTDIPTRLPAARARSVAPATATLPEATVREGVRAIAMPAASTGSGQSNARPSAATAQAGNAAQSGGPPAASTGTSRAAAAASGAGPRSTPQPGAWSTPRRGDDWGASDRNRPGGNTGNRPGNGLFNADGSPRLPPSVAGGDTGYPPGSDDWTRERLDRSGSFLKRPPNRYSPTRFDEYWIPSGTLLEEWVRRGVKKLSIPVPGTSKKIECVVSILQLGGGCGVSDPDQDVQPSTGRAAPVVPFKPELQEDQDSLSRPGTPN